MSNHIYITRHGESMLRLAQRIYNLLDGILFLNSKVHI